MFDGEDDDKLTTYNGSYKVLRDNLGEAYADLIRYALFSTTTGIGLSSKMQNSWGVWIDVDWIANSANPIATEIVVQFMPAIWNSGKKTIELATSDKDLREKLSKPIPNKVLKNLYNVFNDLSNRNFEKAMNSALGTQSLKEKKEMEKKSRSRTGQERIFRQKDKLYK